MVIDPGDCSRAPSNDLRSNGSTVPHPLLLSNPAALSIRATFNVLTETSLPEHHFINIIIFKIETLGSVFISSLYISKVGDPSYAASNRNPSKSIMNLTRNPGPPVLGSLILPERLQNTENLSQIGPRSYSAYTLNSKIGSRSPKKEYYLSSKSSVTFATASRLG